MKKKLSICAKMCRWREQFPPSCFSDRGTEKSKTEKQENLGLCAFRGHPCHLQDLWSRRRHDKAHATWGWVGKGVFQRMQSQCHQFEAWQYGWTTVDSARRNNREAFQYAEESCSSWVGGITGPLTTEVSMFKFEASTLFPEVLVAEWKRQVPQRNHFCDVAPATSVQLLALANIWHTTKRPKNMTNKGCGYLITKNQVFWGWKTSFCHIFHVFFFHIVFGFRVLGISIYIYTMSLCYHPLTSRGWDRGMDPHSPNSAQPSQSLGGPRELVKSQEVVVLLGRWFPSNFLLFFFEGGTLWRAVFYSVFEYFM